MPRLRLSFLLSITAISGCAFFLPQVRTISGSVTDMQRKTPLPGVHIELLRENWGGFGMLTTSAQYTNIAETVTDATGRFQLRWEDGPSGGSVSVSDIRHWRGKWIPRARHGQNLTITLGDEDRPKPWILHN